MRPALVLLALLVCAPLTARAHRFEHPKSLRLGIREDGRLVLAIAYDVNPGRDAERTRAMFDRNADGTLDPTEQGMVLDAFVKTCWQWLGIEAARGPLSWRPRDRVGHRLDRPVADDSTLGVSLVYDATAPEGDDLRLTIRDRDKDRAKHVPLVVDLGPGWHVKLASQGEWHPGPRQLTSVMLTPERPLELVISRTSDAPPAPARVESGSAGW